jgi:hypothetical protein
MAQIKDIPEWLNLKARLGYEEVADEKEQSEDGRGNEAICQSGDSRQADETELPEGVQEREAILGHKKYSKA